MGAVRRCCLRYLCPLLAVALAFLAQRLWAAWHVEEPPADLAPAKTAALPTLPLPGGGLLPLQGLGMCCRLSSLGDSARRSVLWYLLLGGRLIDGAETYGNHKEIGQGIREALARGVPRGEVFFTTKIPGHLFGFDSAKAWFRRMLTEVGLDYVDLVLLHAAGPEKRQPQVLACGSMPDGMRKCREETWLALSELRAEGLVRHLGVSNFGPRQISELLLLEKAAPVAVNQLEWHPWVARQHREAVAFCHARGIAVTAHTLFGGQFGRAAEEPALASLAERRSCSARQLLLRWALQRNVSVVAGSGRPGHMRANLEALDAVEALSPAEMAEVDALGERGGERVVFAKHTPDLIK